MSGLKFRNSEKYLSSYIEFSSEINILPVTEASVEISSQLYASLRKEGNSLDDMDLLIAGTGLEYNCILATGNQNHFERIRELKIENWTKPLTKS